MVIDMVGLLCSVHILLYSLYTSAADLNEASKYNLTCPCDSSGPASLGGVGKTLAEIDGHLKKEGGGGGVF